MNGELPDVQAGFWRGRRTRDQIANIPWIMEKAREFQQNIYFFFIVQKTLTMCITTNWKILRDWIPDHLTCLLRNLYVGQEDPLEKEMVTLSSILAWEIPWTEEPGGL